MAEFVIRAGREAQINDVDPQLLQILRTAAERAPPTISRVEAFSGLTGRSTGTKSHPGGYAVDVQLYDMQGRPVDNYIGKAAPTAKERADYAIGEQFAQTVRVVQMENYPELADQMRWGGYFMGGPNPQDMMHFDLAGGRSSKTPPQTERWANGLEGKDYSVGKRALAAATQSAGRQPIELTAVDRDIAIRTILGEAVGEGAEGQTAVAQVIANRYDQGYGPSIAAIAGDESQFDAWNHDQVLAYQPGSPEYEQAGKIVDEVFTKRPEPPPEVGNSTEFYSGEKEPGYWAKGAVQKVGQVGGHVFGAIKNAMTRPKSFMLRPGARGAEPDPRVAALQTQLKQAGVYQGEVDGRYGPQTTAAVKAWQKQSGARPTGLADTTTLRSLKLPSSEAGFQRMFTVNPETPANRAKLFPEGEPRPTNADAVEELLAYDPLEQLRGKERSGQAGDRSMSQRDTAPSIERQGSGQQQGSEKGDRTMSQRGASSAVAAATAADDRRPKPPTPPYNPRRDPAGFPIDVYRPEIANSDGSISTERTTTFDAAEVGLPPEIVTVSTIVDGKPVSEAEARRLFAEGKNEPVQRGFKTFEEADAAAEARSRSIPAARATALKPDAAPASSANAGTTHRAKKGDTFGKLAKQYLGDANRWPEIEKANPGIKARSIPIGTELVIPGAASPPTPRAKPDTSQVLNDFNPSSTSGPSLETIRRLGLTPEVWDNLATDVLGGTDRTGAAVDDDPNVITEADVEQQGRAMVMGNDRQWFERNTGGADALRPQGTPPPRAPLVAGTDVLGGTDRTGAVTPGTLSLDEIDAKIAELRNIKGGQKVATLPADMNRSGGEAWGETYEKYPSLLTDIGYYDTAPERGVSPAVLSADAMPNRDASTTVAATDASLRTFEQPIGAPKLDRPTGDRSSYATWGVPWDPLADAAMPLEEEQAPERAPTVVNTGEGAPTSEVWSQPGSGSYMTDDRPKPPPAPPATSEAPKPKGATITVNGTTYQYDDATGSAEAINDLYGTPDPSTVVQPLSYVEPIEGSAMGAPPAELERSTEFTRPDPVNMMALANKEAAKSPGAVTPPKSQPPSPSSPAGGAAAASGTQQPASSGGIPSPTNPNFTGRSVETNPITGHQYAVGVWSNGARAISGDGWTAVENPDGTFSYAGNPLSNMSLGV